MLSNRNIARHFFALFYEFTNLSYKAVKVTYKNSKPLSLWDEALNYNEVPIYLLNA